jgi:hypothetical protein
MTGREAVAEENFTLANDHYVGFICIQWNCKSYCQSVERINRRFQDKLPRSKRSIPEQPCEPMKIKSDFHSSAFLRESIRSTPLRDPDACGAERSADEDVSEHPFSRQEIDGDAPTEKERGNDACECDQQR